MGSFKHIVSQNERIANLIKDGNLKDALRGITKSDTIKTGSFVKKLK